jgi:hypothetical protein
MTPWPAERTAALRKLLRQGLNDREIAERLGVTSRAVNGKRQRLGLMGLTPGRPRREVDKKARAENEAPWKPPPGMLKLRCQRCSFWFVASEKPVLLCADCAIVTRYQRAGVLPMEKKP